MTTHLLADLSALIGYLEHDYKLAKSCVDQGDGLRSPNLEGRVSGGGGSDPVGELVVKGWPEPKDDEDEAKQPRKSNAAKARLEDAEADIAAAKVQLVNAWADALEKAVADVHRNAWPEPTAVGVTPRPENVAARVTEVVKAHLTAAFDVEQVEWEAEYPRGDEPESRAATGAIDSLRERLGVAPWLTR